MFRRLVLFAVSALLLFPVFAIAQCDTSDADCASCMSSNDGACPSSSASDAANVSAAPAPAPDSCPSCAAEPKKDVSAACANCPKMADCASCKSGANCKNKDCCKTKECKKDGSCASCPTCKKDGSCASCPTCIKDDKNAVLPSATDKTPPAIAVPEANHGDVKTVTVEQVQTMIKEKKPVFILDARTGKYDDGVRIPGAISLSDKSTAEEIAAVIPAKDAEIVTYCSNVECPASMNLLKHLQTLGYTNVQKMPDGLDGWKKAGNETIAPKPAK
ncbi:MAG: rhodanese-like domain-containing protein [Candidatus Riflebacteria bacterium]|nr:rhodanese-like domain-containing protein [Candidatus Riflebacteria bacterium]